MKAWWLVGLAIAGGALAWRATASTATRAPAIATTAARDDRFPVGQRRRFRLESERALAFDRRAPVTVTLAASWTETVVSGGPAGRWLHVGLGDVAVMPAVALPTELFVSVADDGRVRALAFDPATEPVARALLTAIATELQVAVPPGRAPGWQVDEQWERGRATASYVRAGSHLDKQRVRVAPVDDLAVAVIGSRGAIELDGAGRVASVELDEQLRVHTPVGLGFTTRVHTRAALVAADDIGTRAVALAARRARAELHRELAAPAPAPLAHERQLLGDATYAGLLAELAGLAGDTAGERRRAAIAARLRALFVLDDDAVADAGSTLLADPTPEEVTILTGALSAAATPTSVELLADLAGDHDTPAAVRGEAVVELGLTGAPTARSTAALVGLLDGGDPALARAAALAIGSAARRSPPDQRAALVDRLLALEARAADEPARVHALTALGNAGDARALIPLARALAGGGTGERVAAVNALRLIDGDGAERALASALADPDRAVRARAEAVRRDRARRAAERGR